MNTNAVMFPDYSKILATYTDAGTRTAPQNCVLIATVTTTEGGASLTVVIDGTMFLCNNNVTGGDYPHFSQAFFPLKSGQSFNISQINLVTARLIGF